jgi:tetratricopeptide (TPR) repeat protein
MYVSNISRPAVALALSVFFLACFAVSCPGQVVVRHFEKADSCFFIQDWANARQAYKQAGIDTSHSSLEWNRLGFSDYNLGRNDEAMAAYTRSASNNPLPFLQPILYSRTAMVQAAMKEKAKALENLDKAIKAGYFNFVEMDTLADFAALRGDVQFKTLRDKAYAIAFPCTADPKRHAFDFWIGEWNAYTTGTTVLAGHSLIQSASGGCMVLENWESVRLPYNGKSMNFIDAATGKWQQVWVGAEGGPQHVFVNGEYRDSAMRFDFEQPGPNGKTQKGRFTFFNQGPDQVRQLNETSDDDGKTWNVAYDFTYIRKKSQ